MSSNAILVIGKSGTGKTTSLENLPPKETFIIQCTKKDLPFKGAKKNFTKFSKENADGNLLVTDKSGVIIKTLEHINNNRKDIKYVVIDDFVYSMANEFVRRGHEKGFDKWNDIGISAAQILQYVTNNMRDDISIALFNHPSEYTDPSGVKQEKFKTLGNLVDDKLNPEGMFSTVLYTDVTKNDDGKMEYGFLTQNTGLNTGKSPRGMFKKSKIPNDLKLVFDAMDAYYIG
jgi:hypothetical protein